MPDIDVDVPIDKREQVIQYIRDTYGDDKVSQMTRLALSKVAEH